MFRLGLFELINTKCGQLGIQLNPNRFLIDFEVSMKNAVLATFPQCTIQYCFFHLTKSLWTKLQKKGLQVFRLIRLIIRKLIIVSQTLYCRNEEFSIRMRMIAALAFTRQAETLHCYQLLRTEVENWVRTLEMSKQYSKRHIQITLQDFTAYPNLNVGQCVAAVFDYFSKFYVEGVLRQDNTRGRVRFPIETWNVHDVSLQVLKLMQIHITFLHCRIHSPALTTALKAITAV